MAQLGDRLTQEAVKDGNRDPWHRTPYQGRYVQHVSSSQGPPLSHKRLARIVEQTR